MRALLLGVLLSFGCSGAPDNSAAFVGSWVFVAGKISACASGPPQPDVDLVGIGGALTITAGEPYKIRVEYTLYAPCNPSYTVTGTSATIDGVQACTIGSNFKIQSSTLNLVNGALAVDYTTSEFLTGTSTPCTSNYVGAVATKR